MITAAPISTAPITGAPVTAAPVTAAPNTAAPITAAPAGPTVPDLAQTRTGDRDAGFDHGVQVTDRHSTNGVVIVTAGVDLRCVPGVPTPVPDGSTVRFGDRSLVVQRA